MPSSTIPAQLRAALDGKGLTLYGAAQIVGAETDEQIKTLHKRMASYTSDRPPKTLVQLQEVCSALGLTITIE